MSVSPCTAQFLKIVKQDPEPLYQAVKYISLVGQNVKELGVFLSAPKKGYTHAKIHCVLQWVTLTPQGALARAAQSKG